MTAVPHRQSFLAFAAYVDEHFEKCDRLMYGKAPSTSVSNAAETELFDRYYAWREAGRIQFFEILASRKIGRPVGRDIVSLLAESMADVDALRAAMGAQIAGGQPDFANAAGDDWRPQRWTIVRIVVGAYLSLPESEVRTYAVVAELLNRGIPTGGKGALPDQVRHALSTFARRAVRFSPDEWLATCRCLLLKWRTLDAIWHQAVEKSRRPDLGQAEKLALSGRLFGLRHAAEITTGPGQASPSVQAEVDLMRRSLAELLREQERRKRKEPEIGQLASG